MEGMTDWNDLHVAAGLDALRAQLLPLVPAGAGPEEDESPEVEQDSGPAPAGGWGGDDDWRSRLIREDNKIVANHANAYLILSHDERWAGVLAYDEFSTQIIKLKPPPYSGGCAGTWGDTDIAKTLVWLQTHWRLGIKVPKVADDAAKLVAWDNRRHVVREWLESLPAWDGMPRLMFMLEGIFGAKGNAFVRHVSQGFLVSLVARVMDPGCKVDTMVVLESDQGRGKSTALRELVGAEWYVDLHESPSSKDFYVVLQGAWLIEIAEMQSFSKADVNQVKKTVSGRDDKFRAPYDKYATYHQRQCVFVGTTNADAYLTDPTGARRFLPIQCGTISLELLRELRLQLWAEALQLYRDGFRWWEYPADIAQEEQEARFVVDSWEEILIEYLEGRASANSYLHRESGGPITWVTTSELLQHALKIEIAKHGPAEQRRVAAIMRRLKWRYTLNPQPLPGSKTRARYFMRPEPAVMHG